MLEEKCCRVFEACMVGVSVDGDGPEKEIAERTIRSFSCVVACYLVLHWALSYLLYVLFCLVLSVIVLSDLVLYSLVLSYSIYIMLSDIILLSNTFSHVILSFLFYLIIHNIFLC